MASGISAIRLHFGITVPELRMAAADAFRARGASPRAFDGFAHLAGLADAFSLVDAEGAPDVLGGTRALCTAFEAWLASVEDERTELVGTSIVYSRVILAIAVAAHEPCFADDWRDAAADIVKGYYADAEQSPPVNVAVFGRNGASPAAGNAILVVSK